MLLLGFMMCMKLHMPPRLQVSSSNCAATSTKTGRKHQRTQKQRHTQRTTGKTTEMQQKHNNNAKVHRRKKRNLATTGFSEVSHRTELGREQDGCEEAAVQRLNAFACALFVGVSAGGRLRRPETGGDELALDVHVAQHVIADVAADVELLHTTISAHEKVRLSC
jgi:hypothetical protein